MIDPVRSDEGVEEASPLLDDVEGWIGTDGFEASRSHASALNVDCRSAFGTKLHIV